MRQPLTTGTVAYLLDPFVLGYSDARSYLEPTPGLSGLVDILKLPM